MENLKKTERLIYAAFLMFILSFFCCMYSDVYSARLGNTSRDVAVGVYITASDSSAADKAKTTYHCTGTADEVLINSTVAGLTSGGTVTCAAGTYYLAGQIKLYSNITFRAEKGAVFYVVDSADNFTSYTPYGEHTSYAIITNISNDDGGAADTNIKIEGIKIVANYYENSYTIATVAGDTLTIAGDVTGDIAMNDYITIADISAAIATSSWSKRYRVQSIVYSPTTTTIVMDASITGAATGQGDLLYTNGPWHTKDGTWAGIWLDNADNCTITDCDVTGVYYPVPLSTYRGFNYLITNCDHTVIYNCKSDYAGYEGFGWRGGATNQTIDTCVSNHPRSHSFQAGGWYNQYATADNRNFTMRNLSTDVITNAPDICFDMDGESYVNENINVSECQNLSVKIMGNTRHVNINNNKNCLMYIFTADGSASNIDDISYINNVVMPLKHGDVVSVASVGDGNTVSITSPAHGLTTADYVTFYDTNNLDGVEQVTVVDANTFTVVDLFVSDQIGGWVEASKSAVVIEHEGDGHIDDVKISGNSIQHERLLTATLLDGNTGRLRNLQISDNQIINDSQLVYLLSIAGSTGTIEKINITKNKRYQEGPAITAAIDLSLAGSGHFSELAIVGNDIHCAAANRLFRSLNITADGNVVGVSIANNYISNCFSVFTGDDDCFGVNILNNIVNHCDYVVENINTNSATPPTDVYVSGNFFGEIDDALTRYAATANFGLNDGVLSGSNAVVRLWKVVQDVNDNDIMYLQMGTGASTWSTIDTWNASP